MKINIPDPHFLDRDIPAGKTLLAEYGDIGADEPRPVETVLDTKIGWGRTPVRLVAITAGCLTGRCGAHLPMDPPIDQPDLFGRSR